MHQTTAPLLCYRYLGEGHFVRECIDQLRCWLCYNYGHKKIEHTKWLSYRRTKWAPKPNTLATSGDMVVHIEPCTNQGEVTKAYPTITPPSHLSSLSTPAAETSDALPPPSSTTLGSPVAMSNLTINPNPFKSTWMFVEDGSPHQQAKTTVHISS
jgi:hypothetical protein